MPEDETKPPFPVTPDQPSQPPPDSSIFNVSVRAWLAVILVTTVCTAHLLGIAPSVYIAIKKMDLQYLNNITTVGEPLYSMAVAALGFYFGQKKQQ